MVTMVTGAEISIEEKEIYEQMAREKYGDSLESLEIHVDGDEVELKYHMNVIPFERVRRITGYLVGTMDKWNDAKRAEEHDRVKHGTENNANDDR